MPMLKPKVSWFLKFWVGSLVVLIPRKSRKFDKDWKIAFVHSHVGIPGLSPASLRKVKHNNILQQYNREPLSFTKFYGDMNPFPSLQLGLTPAMLCLC